MNSTRLPTAIIIGAQKCGTTTLFNSLLCHSNIEPPRSPRTGRVVKECDFFCWDNKYSKGVEWYASHFKGEPRCFIEASPNYLATPRCFSRIREAAPNAKLIVCIRNPVSRAYSQYNHYRQDYPMTADWDWDHRVDFLENLKIERERPLDLERGYKGMLLRGIYVGQLKLLLEVFDRAQVYISVTERWHADFAAECARVQRFLGLEVEPLSSREHHRRAYSVEPMREEARALLVDYYKSCNEELFEFLGYDIPEWRDTLEPPPRERLGGLVTRRFRSTLGLPYSPPTATK